MDDIENNAENNQDAPEKSENEQEIKAEAEENTSPDTEVETETPSLEDDKEEVKAQDEDDLPLPSSDEAGDKKKDIPKWAEKKLTKKEREAALLRAENEKLRNAIQNNNTPNLTPYVNTPMEAPQRDAYETEHEYISAVVKFENAKAAQEFHVERREKEIMAAEMEFQNNLKDTLDKGADKYDDFEEKTAILFSNEFPTNRAMGEAILDSPYKDDILYFLGTYAKEAIKIAQMNPIKAVKEIAKLESRFASRAKTTTSKAPAPLDPVNTSRSKTSSIENMQDLQRIASTDDQRGFEAAVKKLANKRNPF